MPHFPYLLFSLLFRDFASHQNHWNIHICVCNLELWRMKQFSSMRNGIINIRFISLLLNRKPRYLRVFWSMNWKTTIFWDIWATHLYSWRSTFTCNEDFSFSKESLNSFLEHLIFPKEKVAYFYLWFVGPTIYGPWYYQILIWKPLKMGDSLAE